MNSIIQMPPEFSFPMDKLVKRRSFINFGVNMSCLMMMMFLCVSNNIEILSNRLAETLLSEDVDCGLLGCDVVWPVGRGTLVTAYKTIRRHNPKTTNDKASARFISGPKGALCSIQDESDTLPVHNAIHNA
jgi:hypothetical protein